MLTDQTKNEQDETFETVRNRLDEILEELNTEGITLDDALVLYEEAVKLGLSACDLSEQDILEADEAALDGEEVALHEASGTEDPSAIQDTSGERCEDDPSRSVEDTLSDTE